MQELIYTRNLDFSELYGKIIAIDAPNIISALLSFSRKKFDVQDLDTIIDCTQRPISHLYGLLYRVLFYYSKRIMPIFCFDGKESDLKRKITKNLLNDIRYTRRIYQEAMSSNDYELARRIAFGQDYIWPNIIKESKELLNAIGIPTIESPASAESQCAQLVKDKIAYYTNSQDFDSLLFGCPRTIQNLSKSRRRKQQGRWSYEKIDPHLIDLKENLNRLGINQFQLVDMALLIGTDYYQGIYGIGPKIALKLIKNYGEIENVISKEYMNYNFTSLTSELITQVRKIFLLPDTITNFDRFFWNHPNKTQIKHLLCENHHLNKERVMKNVEKLVKYYNDCKALFKKQINRKFIFQKTLDLGF